MAVDQGAGDGGAVGMTSSAPPRMVLELRVGARGVLAGLGDAAGLNGRECRLLGGLGVDGRVPVELPLVRGVLFGADVILHPYKRAKVKLENLFLGFAPG